MNPDPLRLRSQQVKLGREFLGCAPVVSSPSTLINASKSRRMPLYFHALYTGASRPMRVFPRSRYERLRSRLSRGKPQNSLRLQRRRVHGVRTFCLRMSQSTRRALSGSMDRAERRRIGLRPWTPLLIPRTLHLLGGAIAALEHVAGQGGVAGNMAGERTTHTTILAQVSASLTIWRSVHASPISGSAWSASASLISTFTRGTGPPRCCRKTTTLGPSRSIARRTSRCEKPQAMSTYQSIRAPAMTSTSRWSSALWTLPLSTPRIFCSFRPESMA